MNSTEVINRIRDHLESAIAPVRVSDIWTSMGMVVVSVPACLSDAMQSMLALVTGAKRVNMVRYPDRTLIFLEL